MFKSTIKMFKDYIQLFKLIKKIRAENRQNSISLKNKISLTAKTKKDLLEKLETYGVKDEFLCSESLKYLTVNANISLEDISTENIREFTNKTLKHLNKRLGLIDKRL